MKRRIEILIMAAVIPFMFASCGKEPEKPQEPLKRAPQAKAPAASSEQDQPQDTGVKNEDAAEVKQRNPFMSHLMVYKPSEAKRPKRALECCEVTTFKLVAVIAGVNTPAALVQSPDGKRYIVKKGDLMGQREGKVVRIDDRSITVREFSMSEEGKPSPMDTEIKLPSYDKGSSEFSN